MTKRLLILCLILLAIYQTKSNCQGQHCKEQYNKLTNEEIEKKQKPNDMGNITVADKGFQISF